jgi:hypothetical protein
VESSDAEALPVDSGTLPLKSPWRGENPRPMFYDEFSETTMPKCVIDDSDVKSILRRLVQDDAGVGGNP